MIAYREAMELVPDAATNGEAPFWVGVTLAAGGRELEAQAFLLLVGAEFQHQSAQPTHAPERSLGARREWGAAASRGSMRLSPHRWRG